jgi:glycosyltransferase involved in cell wall biosynthesis
MAIEKYPDISIIMPCFNGSATLGQAVNSVLSQSYKNYELIIIDDWSTDDSQAIAQSYVELDCRIIFIKNNKYRKGVSYARNAGIEISRGRYLCFLDCDDYLLDDSLKLRIDSLRSSNCPIVFGSYHRLECNNTFKPVLSHRDITIRDMFRRNMIGNLAGMYDTQRLPKMRQKDIRHEDYLMWCELMRISGKAEYIAHGFMGVYRISGQSLSGNKIKSALWHWNILRHELELDVFRSFLYQALYIVDSIRIRLF